MYKRQHTHTQVNNILKTHTTGKINETKYLQFPLEGRGDVSSIVEFLFCVILSGRGFSNFLTARVLKLRTNPCVDIMTVTAVNALNKPEKRKKYYYQQHR